MKLRQIRHSLRNAVAAFHPNEANYHLAIGTFGGFEVAYREGTVDERVIAQSFEKDIFFQGVPEYQPQAGHTIMDIGAHIGTFSLAAAAKAPGIIVHAIEASRETFNYLKVNAALNPEVKVLPYHLALAGTNGNVVLNHSAKSWGHSIMSIRATGGEVVRSKTLTTFLDDESIDAIDFVKFNCEGAEFPIITGTSHDVLRRFKTMLILYHMDLAVGHRVESLVQYMRNAGFAVDMRKLKGERGWLVAQQT